MRLLLLLLRQVAAGRWAAASRMEAAAILVQPCLVALMCAAAPASRPGLAMLGSVGSTAAAGSSASQVEARQSQCSLAPIPRCDQGRGQRQFGCHAGGHAGRSGRAICPALWRSICMSLNSTFGWAERIGCFDAKANPGWSPDNSKHISPRNRRRRLANRHSHRCRMPDVVHTSPLLRSLCSSRACCVKQEESGHVPRAGLTPRCSVLGSRLPEGRRIAIVAHYDPAAARIIQLGSAAVARL